MSHDQKPNGAATPAKGYAGLSREDQGAVDNHIYEEMYRDRNTPGSSLDHHARVMAQLNNVLEGYGIHDPDALRDAPEEVRAERDRIAGDPALLQQARSQLRADAAKERDMLPRELGWDATTIINAVMRNTQNALRDSAAAQGQSCSMNDVTSPGSKKPGQACER